MKDNYKADVSNTEEFDRMYQEMVKQAEDKYKVKSEHPKTEEEIGLVDNFSSRWVNEFELPNGYIFKDENGNVINATKIILEKKKKEYPKTYEECVKILGQNADVTYGYKKYVLHTLQMLLVCRDAYWKLYGEEMGLYRPWKPDYMDLEQTKFCIVVSRREVGKWETAVDNYILAFPTRKMRDAFKENFDPDIEFCKEFL